MSSSTWLGVGLGVGFSRLRVRVRVRVRVRARVRVRVRLSPAMSSSTIAFACSSSAAGPAWLGLGLELGLGLGLGLGFELGLGLGLEPPAPRCRSPCRRRPRRCHRRPTRWERSRAQRLRAVGGTGEWSGRGARRGWWRAGHAACGMRHAGAPSPRSTTYTPSTGGYSISPFSAACYEPHGHTQRFAPLTRQHLRVHRRPVPAQAPIPRARRGHPPW